jgi:hypothetical protein
MATPALTSTELDPLGRRTSQLRFREHPKFILPIQKDGVALLIIAQTTV